MRSTDRVSAFNPDRQDLTAPRVGDLHVVEVSFLIWLVGMLYWLVSHPYDGLYHDALVYALLVARQLDPPALSTDLFFKFGAQDSFNLFSPVYAHLIAWFGFDSAAKAVVASGGVLWVSGGLAFSLSAMPDRRAAYFLAIFLAVATYSYSPNAATFRINEGFATARVIAMPLALCALAFWYSGRSWCHHIALVIALLATAIHPLIGIWVLLLFAADKLSDRVAVAAGIGGLGVLFALSAIDGLPLFRPMDAEWAGIVKASTRDVFAGAWGVFRLSSVLGVIAALWLGGRLGSPARRRGYLLAAMLVGWMCLLSQVCSYWWPIEIVIQSQPWRVLWIGTLLAAAAAVDVGWLAFRRGPAAAALTLCLALLLTVYWEQAFAFLFVLILLSGSERVVLVLSDAFSARLVSSRYSRQAFWALLVVSALIMSPAYWLDLELSGAGLNTPWWPGMDGVRGLLLGGSVAVLALLWLAEYRWPRRLLLLAVIPLAGLAAQAWDNRLPLAKDFERSIFAPSDLRTELQAVIPAGDVIAWPGQHRSVWFELGRANYVSEDQTIGMVFSRPRTFEATRRAERLAAATEMADEKSIADLEPALERYRQRVGLSGLGRGSIHAYFSGAPTAAGLRFLCEDSALDWVISSHDETAVRRRATLSFTHGSMGRQFLYNCDVMRRQSAGG